MARHHTEDFRKQLFTKSEPKARLSSKNRSKSCLSPTNYESGDAGQQGVAERTSDAIVLHENDKCEPNMFLLCIAVRSRLMRYPDRLLSTQYHGTLLRILEHCQDLEGKCQATVRDKADNESRESTPSIVQLDESNRKLSFQRYCPTCSCPKVTSGLIVPRKGSSRVSNSKR